MSETVIALFPESRHGEEVIDMLANRGLGSRDVEKLGGRTLASATGPDLIDKLADLGVCEVEQLESLVEAINHGALLLAARTPDDRKAAQIEDLMRDHGATQCLHLPDTGWTTA